MLKNLVKKLNKSEILKSSSLIFVINNLNNLVNYGLIIASRWVLKDDFSIWVVTTSFIVTFLKNISNFSKDGENKPFLFYNLCFNLFKKHFIWILAFLPFLWLIAQSVLRLNSPIFLGGLLIFVILSLILGFQMNYFLGVLDIKSYTKINLTSLIVRVFVTVVILITTQNVFALVAGQLFGTIAGLIYAQFLINKVKLQTQKPTESNLQVDWNLIKKELINNFIFLSILSLFLNLDITLSRSFMLSSQSDIYSIISTFGQIAHFGPISFATLLIPFIAKSGERKTYYTYFGIISLLSLSVSLIYFLFGQYLLAAFKTAYSEQILIWMLLYSIYILFYNLFYISVHSMIAKSKYKSLLPVFGFLFIYLISLYLVGYSFKYNQEVISGFIAVNIFCLMLVSGYMFFAVRKAYLVSGSVNN